MNLYFLNYNNYYNRIVKREDTLEDYLDYLVGEPVQGVINWNPNDGVSTSQILNSWNYDTPDYMLAVTEDGEIDSRWFVIESEYLRNSQYRVQLYRDVIVDNYDTVINSPCFIEKATPTSIRDPAIYNSEDMTYNQIKHNETLLWDETHCPWIVGYIPRDSFKEATEISIYSSLEGSADITVTNLSEYQYYQYNNQQLVGAPTNPSIRIKVCQNVSMPQSRIYENLIALNNDGEYTGLVSNGAVDVASGYTYTSLSGNAYSFLPDYARMIVQQMPDLADQFKTSLYDYIPANTFTPSQIRTIYADNGKTIYESSTGLYYRVFISKTDTQEVSGTIQYSSALGLQMQQKIVKDFSSYTLNDPTNSTDTFTFTGDGSVYTFRIDQLAVSTFKTTIPAPASRYHAAATPYDIFCIPYTDGLEVKMNGQPYLTTSNKNGVISLAQQIAASAGSGNIYDVQLLPYCPVRYCIKEDGTFDIGDAFAGDILSGTSSEKLSIVLWATTDNFSFDIPISIAEEQTVLGKKIKNETEFIRIVAPNFSNSFQFDPQMNEGLDYVTVLCHYKPFNPYIKIQPNFKGLYGSDFNDSRGLVCNGDFSLAQVTSAWADFELQNKNYQNIFNREIQNMQVTNDVQRQREIAGAITGGLSGAAGGAALGAMAGGPIGAGVGGGLGAIASGIGGWVDYGLNEQLRNEALDYKRDMFGYNLQNIQALPQGLAKTSAISPDNKYVPFIEYYGCTDIERQALQDKLTYNGYTIMRIGNIANYLQTDRSYIKGRIIRIEDISDDFHLLKAIADEIYKGVFI